MDAGTTKTIVINEKLGAYFALVREALKEARASELQIHYEYSSEMATNFSFSNVISRLSARVGEATDEILQSLDEMLDENFPALEKDGANTGTITIRTDSEAIGLKHYVEHMSVRTEEMILVVGEQATEVAHERPRG